MAPASGILDTCCAHGVRRRGNPVVCRLYTKNFPKQGVHHGCNVSPGPLAPPPRCAGTNPPSGGSGTATHVSVDSASLMNRHMVFDAGDLGGGSHESLARGTQWQGVLGAQRPCRGLGD